MNVRDLGIIEYAQAYSMQKQLNAEVGSGSIPETFLLLEHQPVYTIGRNGKETNLLDPSVDVIRINRGGDVTFHCPGQLVGYPIVNLSLRGKDLHRYLRLLEELIIDIATEFGVDSYRVEGKTGVWTDRGKLASIGVGARRWVTMHGFALNVNPAMEGFNRINPCGIKGCPVTSLALEGDTEVSMDKVKELAEKGFEKLLEEWMPSNLSDVA